MVGHDAHDYDNQLGLLAFMQDRNNKQQTKEITMENNFDLTIEVAELKSNNRELTQRVMDTQAMLDRVSAIGERNTSRLNEALKLARTLIVQAKTNDDCFITDNRHVVDQLVSLGMESFTKKVNIHMSWVVNLTVEAEVEDDFDEDSIDIHMVEEIDSLFGGDALDGDDVLNADWDVDVETRSMRVTVD